MKLFANQYQDEKLDTPNLMMINFKETFSKIKNGVEYLNSTEPEENEDLQSIPEENSVHSKYPDLFSGMGVYGKKQKVESMKTYYADENNFFNFMSKSAFNLRLKAMVGVSPVKVNQFNFFAHGDEYLTLYMVSFFN